MIPRSLMAHSRLVSLNAPLAQGYELDDHSNSVFGWSTALVRPEK